MNKNKTGVQYTNIEYIKSDNATICLLECTIAYKYVTPMFGLCDDFRNKFMNLLESSNVYLDEDGLVFNVKGVTRFDKENEYDEVLGERLALSKAQTKAFTKANSIYYMLAEFYGSMMDKIGELITGTYNVVNHCEAHVVDLIETTKN